MKLITSKNNLDNSLYTNEEFLKDKYIYCKTSAKDYEIYHIFKILKIESNYPIKYSVNRYYYLCVPDDYKIKTYVYDSKNSIEINAKTELYEMSYDEFLDTYRSFIDCDGKYPFELPAKIIKDR